MPVLGTSEVSLAGSNKCHASRNKCIPSSNRCLTSSNKKLVLVTTSKALVTTSDALVSTSFLFSAPRKCPLVRFNCWEGRLRITQRMPFC